MRCLSLLTMCLCVIVCASSAGAKAVTDSTAYQGSLTDASNSPVPDGPHDLTISIWTDSVAGSMLYSEIRTVTTSKGLFTTCIGCESSTFPDIFDGQTLFLQIQLAGQSPMAPRTRLRSVPYSLSATSLYSEATFGSVRSRGIITNKPLTANPKGKILLDQDVDGNGVADLSAETDVDNDSASFRMVALPPGVPVSGMLSLSTAIGGTTFKAIQTKGTGASGMVRLDANDSASISSGFDVDGNGIPDYVLTGVTDDSSSRLGATSLSGAPGNPTEGWNVSSLKTSTRETLTAHFENGDIPTQEQLVSASGSTFKAIQTKGTGASGMTRMEASDSTSFVTEYDANGNGISEARGIVYTKPGSSSGLGSASCVMSYDSNDDGIPDNDASMIVTPTTSSVAIKTKGTGAEKNRVAGTAYPDSATQVVSTDVDGDGTPDNTVESIVTPTTSSVAIKTKGTGADKNRTASSGCDDTSAVVSVEAGDKSNGHADMKANIGAVLNGSVVIGCTMDANGDGILDVLAETRVNADSATIRLNDFPLGLPVASAIAMTATSTGVHMEVGAATCDGTNWVNASDASLKENFHPVDGEQLLDRVEALPISEWNYRTQSDTLKHIGPTAQDFKATFGVGSDGKSISTIDPSGIALAAIKELGRQNRKLKSENEQLKQRLDALTRKVEQLAEGK